LLRGFISFIVEFIIGEGSYDRSQLDEIVNASAFYSGKEVDPELAEGILDNRQ
jgi:hypothetical protein